MASAQPNAQNQNEAVARRPSTENEEARQHPERKPRRLIAIDLNTLVPN